LSGQKASDQPLRAGFAAAGPGRKFWPAMPGRLDGAKFLKIKEFKRREFEPISFHPIPSCPG